MRVCTGCVGACDGPGSQLATCAAGLVRLWSAWTDTAPCLVSCDKGAKRQSRERGLRPATNQTQRTVASNVTSQRAWTAWGRPLQSFCSASRLRARVRYGEGCLGPVCAGAGAGGVPCQESVWAPWAAEGECDVKCGEQKLAQSCAGCITGCDGAWSTYMPCTVVPVVKWGAGASAARRACSRAVWRVTAHRRATCAISSLWNSFR